MKIKLTKRGRAIFGIIGWLLVISASVLTGMALANIADHRQMESTTVVQQCAVDTVLQADGSCTNQE